MISVFSNTLSEEELLALRRVFASRWLGPGEERSLFEKELCAFWDTKNILAVNSCTSALYLAVRALDIGPGDEVIIPAIHFVAVLNAVVDAGAEPVFCDVNPSTLSISINDMMARITYKTKAIMILHYGGHPCDTESVREASGGHIYIVEDAANAPASRIRGHSVGTLADIGCWSFDSMKLLVTADGGAMHFLNPNHYERSRRLRYLGLTSTSGLASASERDRWWEYSVAEPSGYFDMNDVTAAIGRMQLRRLAVFVEARRQIWESYQEELAGVGDIVLPPEPGHDCTSSYYMYWIQTKWRDQLARFLYDNGVYTTFRYYPLHLVRNQPRLHLPDAEFAADHTLNLPIHQNLTSGDRSRIVELIREFYKKQCVRVYLEHTQESPCQMGIPTRQSSTDQK